MNSVDILNWFGLLGAVFGVPCLVYVSTPPDADRRRIELNVLPGKSRPEIPSICVLTGEPATEWHPLRRFFCVFNLFSYGEISLPFGADGYRIFCRQYPISMRVYKGGFFIFSRMNFLLPFGLPFAFLWSIWGTWLCGLIAIVDAVLGRRQLLQLKTDALTGVSDQFSEAFGKSI